MLIFYVNLFIKLKGYDGPKKEVKKQKIKCLNLDDLDRIESESEANSDTTSLNMSLSIRSVQIDMTVNDLRKYKPIFRPAILTRMRRPTDLVEFKNDSSNESELDENDKPLKTLVNGVLTDLNKEFVSGYVKFIYGLSSENPIQNFRLQPKSSSSKETSPSHVLMSASSDSGFVTSGSNNISVSFSNSTSVSFKSRSSTVSAATTPTKSTAVTPDAVVSDPFGDDGDTISMILNMETDDTTSLVNVEIGTTKTSNNLSSQSDVSLTTPTGPTTPSDSQSLCKSESGNGLWLLKRLIAFSYADIHIVSTIHQILLVLTYTL